MFDVVMVRIDGDVLSLSVLPPHGLCCIVDIQGLCSESNHVACLALSGGLLCVVAAAVE